MTAGDKPNAKIPKYSDYSNVKVKWFGIPENKAYLTVSKYDEDANLQS